MFTNSQPADSDIRFLAFARWRLAVLKKVLISALFCTLSVSPGFAAGVSKTMRVDHGRPLVMVSQKAVLLLEFLKEPIKDTLVPHEEPDTRHCQARYRYQLFDGASDSIANGHGTVEEIFQVVSSNATGRQLKDRGSRTGIDAGEFHLW